MSETEGGPPQEPPKGPPQAPADNAAEPAPTDGPYAAAPVRQRNAWRLSLVWLVPVVALLVGAVLVVRTVLQSGPEITIEFRTAEGIEPGRTEIRFKEVVVGRVTAVTLSRDRQLVLVKARLQKSVENIAAEDTRFWVVRPRIGAAGISGLGTLLSGAYIGVDAGVSEIERRRFTGLEAAPYVLRGEPGRSFVLSAEDLGSLDVGSPVYYRRTRVGRVVGYTLNPSTDRLDVQVFVESPNEKLVTQQTRFWNASGVDLSLNARGLTLNTQSLASVISGGVAFATSYVVPGANAPQAPEGQRFHLFDNQANALAKPDGPALTVRMRFEQSSRGLSIGAPIDLLGVEIGSVKDIALQYDVRGQRFPVIVTADVFPARLGNLREQFGGGAASRDAVLMKRLVESGVRAQLRTANLLSGQLYVALDVVPKAARATLDETSNPLILPTAPGALAEIQPQIAEIIAKLGKVDFDGIGKDLQQTLQSAGAAGVTLKDTLKNADNAIQKLTPDAQRSLEDVRQTLKSLQQTLGSLERTVTHPDAPLQINANKTLVELQRAAQALRALSDYLEQHPESLLRGKPADRDVTKTEGAR